MATNQEEYLSFTFKDKALLICHSNIIGVSLNSDIVTISLQKPMYTNTEMNRISLTHQSYINARETFNKITECMSSKKSCTFE